MLKKKYGSRHILTKDHIQNLVTHLRTHQKNIDAIGDIENYYPDDSLGFLDINHWLDNYRNNNPLFTIDARSESEFNDDHLPGAVNFPILNDIERAEVGFLYKKYSPQGALFRAREIAEQKMNSIEEFSQLLKSQKSPVAVYCWRGGKRSSALTHLLTSFGLEPLKIKGGYKAYRKSIHSLFYIHPEYLNFICMTGMTGCGKTELIEHITGTLPVFDIEKAASHASSMFGKVRFDLKQETDIQSQTQFENALFTQTLLPETMNNLPFLTEGESRKINRFLIPGPLFDRIHNSPAVMITSSLEKRVQRIETEYFSSSGPEKVHTIVKESGFLKNLIGKKQVLFLLKLIEEKRYSEFSEWMLTCYYDKRYSLTKGKIITEINTDNMNTAVKEIKQIMLDNRVTGYNIT